MDMNKLSKQTKDFMNSIDNDKPGVGNKSFTFEFNKDTDLLNQLTNILIFILDCKYTSIGDEHKIIIKTKNPFLFYNLIKDNKECLEPLGPVVYELDGYSENYIGYTLPGLLKVEFQGFNKQDKIKELKDYIIELQEDLNKLEINNG